MKKYIIGTKKIQNSRNPEILYYMSNLLSLITASIREKRKKRN
jgi:hypothetical protein